MYNYLFKRVKNIIPKISETEIIALKSGGVSIDREIFKGRVNYKNLLHSKNVNKITADEKEFIQSTNKLLKSVGQDNIYPNKNINSIMNYLGKNGFLSMIIDKKYQGNRISISAQSKALSIISSYNPSLGVVTMVPNSLGPAELLQHYGTEKQKNHYLPKLADGTFIPCFGLTGPNNGSDAVGKIDEGIVELVDGQIKIKIILNKRYITLAPISNLIGIAFNLKDPNKLLPSKKEGITVALIENIENGLIQNTFHNPNNAGFPNGTIKGTIFIETDKVIGGETNIGEGWKMLMECLAVGRGVSLPATANGSSKYITLSIMNYINIRNQFNMPIGNMEAVREKFIDMFINTWIIHAGVNFTNHILDSGLTPSVITAIMKQQTTERARHILNHGMDIYSGSGICIGENNFFTKFYNSSPVGITVEGSNTLTRGLIIFGQGLNKSHPYIFPIFESIQNNDIDKFRSNFNSMFYEILMNYFSLLYKPNFLNNSPIERRLEYTTLKFSLLSNFIALLGGKIKSKQMLSGNMSDILSNIYLSYSILWYHHHFLKNNNHELLKTQCIDNLLNEIDYKMNLIVDNYPIKTIQMLLYPLSNKINYTNLAKKNELYKYVLNNKELNDILKDDIYYKNTVLEKMESIKNMKTGSKEYNTMYNDIISVGEYTINENLK
jgi:acyl-CoA dehydrogenase